MPFAAIFIVVSFSAPGTQHATGQGSGVVAVLEHHLATDDHVVHAVGALHAPRRAAGTVARDLVLAHPDVGEVEDHEVGRQPLADQAAITQTHDPRRLEGVAPDRV